MQQFFSAVKIGSFLLILIISLTRCQKLPEFPDEPGIRFEGFEQLRDVNGKDSAGVLRLYFTDGNGDVGLAPKDTLPPFNRGSKYYYNFYISLFEKQQGQWTRIFFPPLTPGGDTITNNSRIPDLRGSQGERAIEGNLSIVLFTANPFSTFDTIRYEVSIVDRALNQSNMITTSPIVLIK